MLFLCSEVDPHDLGEKPFGLEFAEEFERIEDFGFIPLVPCSGERERGVVDDELVTLVRGVIEREDIGKSMMKSLPFFRTAAAGTRQSASMMIEPSAVHRAVGSPLTQPVAWRALDAW
mgnify:CR=1 FL=1